MTLHFSRSSDQALLTMVVDEAQKQTGGSSVFLGRTALQKILYFLKVLGVPMNYRFDMYHYGPFCAGILQDTDFLIFDGAIKDLSPTPDRYSNYAIDDSQAVAELQARYAESLQQHRATVSSIVRALAPLRPEHLELVSTLDYYYRQARASGRSGPYKAGVIARSRDAKGEKFEQSEMESAYDALAEAGLVEP